MQKQIMILFMVFLVTTSAVMGQDMSKKEARAKAKAEKKATKEAAEAVNAAKITTLIEQRHFVLEANYLANRGGSRITVNPTLNFVMVEKDKATFQFGGGSQVGYNGVGGVTMDGRVQNYKFNIDKKGVIQLSFQISTSRGTVFISLTVVPATSSATATVSSMGPEKLYYTGQIVAPEESRVYKGMTIN